MCLKCAPMEEIRLLDIVRIKLATVQRKAEKGVVIRITDTHKVVLFPDGEALSFRPSGLIRIGPAIGTH